MSDLKINAGDLVVDIMGNQHLVKTVNEDTIINNNGISLSTNLIDYVVPNIDDKADDKPVVQPVIGSTPNLKEMISNLRKNKNVEIDANVPMEKATDYTDSRETGEQSIKTNTTDIAIKENAKDGVLKTQMTRVPQMALRKVAEVLTTNKYHRHNQHLPMDIVELLDAAQRHENSFLCGEDNDPESGKCHLDHAIANLMMAREQMLFYKDKVIDSRFYKNK